MDKKFLKRATKTNIVVMSVVAGIAVIALAMLCVIYNGNDRVLTSLITAITFLLILSIWHGAIQIKVFNDYKNQRKSLCAEGIFNICVTVLIVLTCFLFIALQVPALSNGESALSTVDLRWFIGIFLSAFSIWKIFIIIKAINERRKNWWLEILICILWLLLAVLSILTINQNSDLLLWIMFGACILLIACMPIYNLLSYIYTSPDYLITEEGLSILEKDLSERANRLARLSSLTGATQVSIPTPVVEQKAQESIEDKLAKLEVLKNKGIITEEEYQEKRKKIIDTF